MNANKQLKSCWISGHRRFFPLLWHWIHINSWVGMTTIVQPLLDILNTWIIRSSNCDVTIKLDTVDGIITKLLHIWQPFWGAFPFITLSYFKHRFKLVRVISNTAKRITFSETLFNTRTCILNGLCSHIQVNLSTDIFFNN